MGGAEGVGVRSSLVWQQNFQRPDAYGEGADGCSNHGRRRGESPVWIQALELVQLVQENGGIEFAVVPGPELLDGLVDCLFVPVMEQICDFSGPVHGLNFYLDGFRFVSGDNMIHGAHLAFGLDFYGVSGLGLHLCDIVGSWADLIGGEYTAQVFLESSNIFLRASAILNRQ